MIDVDLLNKHFTASNLVDTDYKRQSINALSRVGFKLRYVSKEVFIAKINAIAALSSATQHAIPSEFGRKWGTECLKTRFPLSTLLHAGYSVKL